MVDTIEEIPQTELVGNSKQLLESTERIVNQTHEDINDIGDQVDYSKMTLEQLRDEVRKMRVDHEQFRWEIKKLIEAEIKKYLEPLSDRLDELMTSKSKVLYIKLKNPLIEFIKRIVDILRKIVVRLKHGSTHK